jgi:uncharacterized repeat protein (TIGR03803 family)
MKILRIGCMFGGFLSLVLSLSAQTFTTVHSFDGTDGKQVFAGLVQAANGYFYGATGAGGTEDAGTIFKITPSGKLTTLYSFCSQSGCPDGVAPDATLVPATNGDLYGTTLFGGASNACSGGCGVVFKITLTGTLTTLHSFDSTDGDAPRALVRATDGNFYGTATQGGANGYGTVFKITPSGKLTTLDSFGPYGFPEATLVLATDGNFYGTTSSGGTAGDGTIFKITPSGKLTTLHTFDGTDGEFTAAALVQDTNGKFYGTAPNGGANGDGTVFSLSVGLGPFVETQPTSGKVGSAVKILGTNLIGATSVTFNGTTAVFKVVSASLITTDVPTGATTGTVEVTTPKGTLKSNVAFRVTK